MSSRELYDSPNTLYADPTLTSCNLDYLNPFQRLDPIALNYEATFDRLCGCNPPEFCTCQRDEFSAREIRAPYDFPKLHACLPLECFCDNDTLATKAVRAPPADLYLVPFKKVVDDHFEKLVQLVSCSWRPPHTRGHISSFCYRRRSGLQFTFFLIHYC